MTYTGQEFYEFPCSTVSEKNPFPPHGRSSEIPRGKGILKVKFLEAKYEAKLEFPHGRGGEGWGCKRKKTLRGGSMDIFWYCIVL